MITILLKAIAGGTIVVLFSLLGEVIRPRGLAGITSAAPSVAVASLLVTVIATGTAAAVDLSFGMIAGAAALIVWCFVGVDAIKRLGAMRGALVTTLVWFVTAFSLWAVFLR